MNELNVLRKQIDQIDQEIIKQLSNRFLVVKKIGQIKKELGIQPLDKNRWKKVLSNRILISKKFGLPTKLIKSIYNLIHEYALKIEK